MGTFRIKLDTLPSQLDSIEMTLIIPQIKMCVLRIKLETFQGSQNNFYLKKI